MLAGRPSPSRELRLPTALQASGCGAPAECAVAVADLRGATRPPAARPARALVPPSPSAACSRSCSPSCHTEDARSRGHLRRGARRSLVRGSPGWPRYGSGLREPFVGGGEAALELLDRRLRHLADARE